MADDYYEREIQTHIDGTPIFQTKRDRDNEDVVARIVEQHFKCELKRFGTLASIDWYAVRSGRLVGLLELKSREHESTRFNTTWLNVRKWLALTIGSVGMRLPAVFVVKFTDGAVGWCKVDEVDASKVRIAGCKKQVKAVSDVGPVIDVPVAQLQWMEKANG